MSDATTIQGCAVLGTLILFGVPAIVGSLYVAVSIACGIHSRIQDWKHDRKMRKIRSEMWENLNRPYNYRVICNNTLSGHRW